LSGKKRRRLVVDGKQNRSICSFECGYWDNHSSINLFLEVKWKEQDSFLKNEGQIYATSALGSIAISVREISLALQIAICYGIPGKRLWGVGYKKMIMRNLNNGCHADTEIAFAVCKNEQNSPISFYLKLGFLSGTFYTDLESAIALRFELDNAIKKAEKDSMDSNEENDKERIISALEGKPLLTEELLEALGYEPGGGELVFPIRELMEEGKIMREKVDTFRYRRC